MSIVVKLDVILEMRKKRSKELAQYVGITKQSISILKSGHARVIRVNTLEKICEFLECQPGNLLKMVSSFRFWMKTFPMFNLPKWVWLIAAIALTTACTKQELYEVIKENQLYDCRQLSGTEREECIAQHQKSYDQYQREREAVIDE